MRRRGYTPEAIRAFINEVGVAKSNSIVDVALLEYHIRQDLNQRADRRMAVLDPLKVIIDNYPEGQEEELEAVNNPEDPDRGVRTVPFSGELYIERDDFMEDPPRKFYRLAPGREVRLRYGYFVTCTGVDKDPNTGEIIALHCTYDPATRGGDAPDGRKVRGTLHWVAANHAVEAEVRLYDRLFSAPAPEDVPEGSDFTDSLNPDSLQVIPAALVEPSLVSAQPGDMVQFERLGYFCVDPDSGSKLVFNRTIALRDSWAKVQSRANN
jgi:glutaminyl-tRNA synthetase